MSALIVLEHMREGRPIRREDLNRALLVVEKQRQIAVEIGAEAWKANLDRMAREIRSYRCRGGVRSKDLILADIRHCAAVSDKFYKEAKLELSARYEKMKEEFEKELQAALLGKKYTPAKEVYENLAAPGDPGEQETMEGSLK